MEQGSSEQIPSLLQHISMSKSIVGFDNTPAPASGPYGVDADDQASVISVPSPVPSSRQPLESRHHHRTISVSMPTTPSGSYDEQAKRVLFSDVHRQQLQKSRFNSQPLQAKLSPGRIPGSAEHHRQSTPRCSGPKDSRFDSFKTWSGRLERQISTLRGRPAEAEEIDETGMAEPEAIPAVDRYFESLEGPELETVKSSEELVLPEDKKWPFLLRFPVTSFGMCLGVSSQAILWKTLATSPSMHFLHVSLAVNLVLWCASLALTAAVTFVYSLKLVFYFEAVKREYHHPVRVNFFFAPWIACLFLAIGVPPEVVPSLPPALWYALMAPILCLELKIYGQWMSGGQRRLSKVANPSNHLSVVGNFAGTLLGASMGLKEGAVFFFAVGLAHYIVLFVTLYQRLPTNETLPKELHPVFFLFVAVPSVACIAWAKIAGDFDQASRIIYFVALFLYISLAVRINFFRGFRFSLAWWAYTLPMSGAATATINYSAGVSNWLTEFLSVALSAISTFTVSALLVSTVLHAFVFHDLFPNDLSIAIKEKKFKYSVKKHSHRRTASSDVGDVLAPV
ncbi:putative S-type anion channel SLAH2 isoform X1 [Iris pallida]|uniref:S-type anion channel SLAH2 isoform X1 n=1 Tax=Iris pallida TaxID=29817 RepID=A0AAX6FPV7_IRIPA|nr:putative S-type anion channel SLAH2 isoform X1 [Iris pallida]